MLTFLTSSPSFDWFLLCHYIHFQNYFIKCTSGNHPEIVMFLLKHNVLYKSIDYFRIQGSATVLENTLSKHSELLVCTLLILWVFQETQILPNNSHPPKLGHLVPRPYLEFWNQKYCRTSSKKGKHHFLLITLSFVQINFVLNKIFSCSDDQKVATKLVSWILLTLASAVLLIYLKVLGNVPLLTRTPFWCECARWRAMNFTWWSSGGWARRAPCRRARPSWCRGCRDSPCWRLTELFTRVTVILCYTCSIIPRATTEKLCEEIHSKAL